MGCSSSQVNDVERLILSDSRASSRDVNVSAREVVVSLSNQSLDDHENSKKSQTQQQTDQTYVDTIVNEVENKGKEKLKSQLRKRVIAITTNFYRPKVQSDELKRCLKALEDAVKRLQAKRLERLQQEKLSYLNRLSEIASVRLRHNNPDIADLSDENRATKLAEKLSELYDNEWTDVFEMTRKGTGNKVADKDIAVSLRNSLKYCYKKCQDMSESQRQKVLVALCMSGENGNIEASPDMRFMLKVFQKDAADHSVLYVQKVISARIVNELKKEVNVITFGKKLPGLYLNSCIKISWHTQIHDPPLVLDFEGKENPTALFRPYTSSGTNLDYVLWPALLLHEGGPIVANLKYGNDLEVLMAKSTDEMFIGDLEECLRFAEELEKVDTEDTKLFVSEQLQKLHKFLQTKQIETEDRIEEQIIKEEHEIEDLKARIARVSQGKGDESDLDYADLKELWRVLKDDYWRAAFFAYIAETEEPADAIINNLLAILKASYDHCMVRVEKSHSDVMFQVFFPGENGQQNKNLKLPKQLDQDLVSMCKKCQMRSTPFCLPSIQQAIVRELKEERTILKQFKTPQKPLLRALEKFAEKCVEFCWIACFEEPEILLVTIPMKECKALAGKFIELDRITYKNRENAAIVEWPAIVQGEIIRIQWQLFAINQPRPQPDKLRLPDNDYRVIRFEDDRGREVHGYDLAEDQNHRRDDDVNVSSADGDIVSQGDHVMQTGRPSEDKPRAPNRNNDKLNITNSSIKKSDVASKQEKGKQDGSNALREKRSNNNNTKYKATKQHQDEKPTTLTSW